MSNLPLTYFLAVVSKALTKAQNFFIKALLSLEESDQLRIAEKIAEEKMTVRQVERLVTQKKGGSTAKNKQKKQDPNLIKLEKDISEALGAKTKITQSTKGSGRIVINFSSLGALQGILEKIKD